METQSSIQYYDLRGLMNRQENEQFVKTAFFDQARFRLTRLAERCVDDAQVVVDEASTIFDGMLPSMAYVDNPGHPLAPALFICNVNLSLYLALKKRGVDAHDFGGSMLIGLARAPIPMPEESDEVLQGQLTRFTLAAKASQENAQPGEDVFEIVDNTQGEFDFAFNVTSCAIFKSALKYDAAEIVPYMCAADDVMSDKGGRGLQRTGSIALGAQKCDFRYRRNGQPRRLAEQYPDRIRIKDVK